MKEYKFEDMTVGDILKDKAKATWTVLSVFASAFINRISPIRFCTKAPSKAMIFRAS